MSRNQIFAKGKTTRQLFPSANFIPHVYSADVYSCKCLFGLLAHTCGSSSRFLNPNLGG